MESQEKAVQQQRELETLYAIYTSPSDIPKTPKEPLDPFTGARSDEVPFGALPDKITVRRMLCCVAISRFAC